MVVDKMAHGTAFGKGGKETKQAKNKDGEIPLTWIGVDLKE